MDTLRSVLTRSEQRGAALGHFNVADLVLLKQPDEIVPYIVLPPVIDSVKQVVNSRLRLFAGPPSELGEHNAKS